MPGRDQCQDHHRITEYGAPAECLGDYADEARRRQEDDVDFRMAEEPEEMLPQQHIATFGRIEEMRSDQAVRE